MTKKWRATTILAVQRDGKVAVAAMGRSPWAVVMKSDAHKIRRLYEGRVVAGFAGASADAFALLERFEGKLKDFQGSVPRAATELAKDWRLDRALPRLEAMLIAADKTNLLLVSGTGDVIQPSDGVVAIGPAVLRRRGGAGTPGPYQTLGQGDCAKFPQYRRGFVHLHQSEYRSGSRGIIGFPEKLSRH